MPKRKQALETSILTSLLPEESGFLKKKTKRKKVKEGDRAFRPGSYTGGTNGNGLSFRYDNEPTVLKEDGLKTPKKWSVIIDPSQINKPLDDEKIQALHHKLTSIDAYTPIEKITQYDSNSGTPITAKSFSGKTLYKQSTNNVCRYFSNKPLENTTTQPVVDPNFYDRSPAKKIKAPETSTKKMSVIINKSTLVKVAQQMKKNQGRRSISQNKILGDSASRYVHAAGIALFNKKEWAHLIAHRFLCDLAQHHENLVATTDHTNTEMMSIEDIIYRLVSKNVEVKIEATAYLLDQTHIASSIDYKVHLDDYEFLFSFHGLQKNKPDMASKLALDAFFSVLFPDKNPQKTSNNTTSQVSLEKKPLLLFSKPKHAPFSDKKTDHNLHPKHP